MKRLIFIIVSAALVGWSVASFVPLRTTKDPWDVVAAVGTVLAVFVAMYFGISAQVKSVLDAREMARLTASRAKATILRQREALGKVHKILKVQGSGTEPDESELLKGMNFLHDVQPYIEFETLLRLVRTPLPATRGSTMRGFGSCQQWMLSTISMWRLSCARMRFTTHLRPDR